MKFNADFKTTQHKRKHDGLVELLGYIYDPTFTEPITEENEAYISRRWVTLGVFTNEQEAKAKANYYHGLAGNSKPRVHASNIIGFSGSKVRPPR